MPRDDTYDITNTQERLFVAFEFLGDNMSDLGAIVQNDISHVTKKDFAFWLLNVRVCSGTFISICKETMEFIENHLNTVEENKNVRS